MVEDPLASRSEHDGYHIGHTRTRGLISNSPANISFRLLKRSSPSRIDSFTFVNSHNIL